jgi:adenosylhomocysteine nucleosidase
VEKDHLICLIMATHLEAKPFIIGLSLVREESEPFPVYKNNDILLVISGIGKGNAAIACACACLKFKPSCIINLGAAGATGLTHAPGEALHVNEAYEYDRPQFKTKAPHKHTPDIIDGFPCAKIATLDRPVLDPAERQKIAKTADLIDMESASVIQSCRKFRTKCYIFKFISDTPEHTTDDDIVKNIREHRDSFFTFFRKSILTKL